MKYFQLVLITMLLFHVSCNQSNTKTNLTQVEQKLSHAQNDIEDALNNSNMKMELTELYKSVKANLILCDNFEFTIRIDSLTNNSLRYVCWKKPKSTTDVPDLIINHGATTENSNHDRQEYVFSNAEWTYSIEKIISGDIDTIVHIFLEISNDKGTENYAWKMRDLSNATVL